MNSLTGEAYWSNIHREMVAKLKKPGEKILESLFPAKCDLAHMAMGVCGEAGELLDAVKKHVMYEKELDTENIIEELGDLEFYMEGIRQITGISRETTLVANYQKLGMRYTGHVYTDKQAQERKDKQ